MGGCEQREGRAGEDGGIGKRKVRQEWKARLEGSSRMEGKREERNITGTHLMKSPVPAALPVTPHFL